MSLPAQHGDRPVPASRRQPQPRDERGDVLQRHLVPGHAPAGQAAEPVLQVMGIRLHRVRRLLRRAQESQEPVHRPDRNPSSPRTVHDTASHGITTRCTRTEHPRHLRDGRRKVTTSTTNDAGQETPVAHVKDSTETARDNLQNLAGQRRMGPRGEHRRRPRRLDPPPGCHDDAELRDADPGTLRYRIWHLPARLARHARQQTLAVSRDWPWKEAFLTCWQRLCALPAPA